MPAGRKWRDGTGGKGVRRAVWGKDGLWSGDNHLEVMRRGSVKDETQKWEEFLAVKSNREFGMGGIWAGLLDTG